VTTTSKLIFTALAAIILCVGVGFAAGFTVGGHLQQRKDASAEANTEGISIGCTSQIQELDSKLTAAYREVKVTDDLLSMVYNDEDALIDELARLKAQRRLIEPYMKSGALIIQERP
jgi:hypothetical protein